MSFVNFFDAYSGELIMVAFSYMIGRNTAKIKDLSVQVGKLLPLISTLIALLTKNTEVSENLLHKINNN